MTERAELQIHIDGELSASAEAPGLIAATPGQAMEIGADAQTGVGDYESPFAFTGVIDEARVYHRALSGAEIGQHCAKPGQVAAPDDHLVLRFSFDRGDAPDESAHGNDGQLEAVEMVEGKSGRGMQFVGNGGPAWSVRVPIRVRAMVAADRLLFVAGPPDVVDPEDPLGSFERRKGGTLWVFSGASGEKLVEYPLDSPPVFNGMAAANGRLYVCGRDGRVLCMEGMR